MRALLAALMFCAFACDASAHPRHHYWHYAGRHSVHHRWRIIRHEQAQELAPWSAFRAAGRAWDESPEISSSRPRDCYGIPWCGCWMRHLFGVTDKAFNVARNWAHWGRAAVAQIGAIVVWPHHVAIIRGGPDARGRWLVQSGNDGHAVRTRYRSLAGAIAFRLPG